MVIEKVIDKNDKKKENTNRRHISFSEFSLFNQCGHRHLLEKHLGILQQPLSIHLFFGNAIHSSIELSLKEKWSINQRIDYFKASFSNLSMNNFLTPKQVLNRRGPRRSRTWFLFLKSWFFSKKHEPLISRIGKALQAGPNTRASLPHWEGCSGLYIDCA